MNITKCSILLAAVFLLTSVPSQAQDRSTGGIKGKVRVETGLRRGYCCGQAR